MLRYQVRGDNIEITPAIRDYIETKVAKLERYFSNELNANVYANAKVRKNGEQKIEITVPLKGLTLRAEEVNSDLYAAVDLTVDKLERQIRKHKTRINRRSREKGSINHDLLTNELESYEEEKHEFVKIKKIPANLMSKDEAILQMELLGHDFFVFLDEDTNEFSVIYKRKDGQYGALELER
ncbi:MULTISPECIES: ribosome-associated translation inhibitor RaiA [unclassified Gemella]|uniref:ribosome hibernation-promoting factor, HPF/YfiA family n=1 Tax=unclassified Gemella TaxID=2624949 RepID=UPI00107497AD|nr:MULTISPECIES: ribosome-associated translation inhibitor RaiA [unclassified Gemella]MBF0710741.1 ribosome-associated translation inhibitor RaiA [Gemella sp. GL1.1]MBF0746690.1 ribosome-associated translation inhibitor RaiA [Gemella sp. 19428wG2_WT2a]NYS28085.1 ribosome-associated translation inhibitor RaiA [Gemella sp. GL1]TFU60039.1 ribosome-associated translation inhibitor RaiA [Gemella sp. WT2a]